MGGYWSATDDYMREYGSPTCIFCGRKMSPADDHGRCSCLFCGRVFDAVTGVIVSDSSEIPQVATDGMDDKTKAKISPINRLDSLPTTAEANFLGILLRGPSAMDSEAYQDAVQKLKKERE